MPQDADAAAWHDIIDPITKALRDLIVHRRDQCDEHGGLPAPDSRAMAEMAESERRWPDVLERDNALEHSIVVGNMLLLAAEDHFLAMCRLYDHADAVVFADRVLLRAGLEACARALWLFDAAISSEDRVARGLTLWIHSKSAMADSISDLRPQTTDHRRALEERVRAAGLAWQTAKSTPPWVGADRYPSASAALRNLFPQEAEDELDLGRTAQSFLSLYVHAVPSALFAVADVDQDISAATGPRGRLRSSATEVLYWLGFITLGYRSASRAQVELLGWDVAAFDERYTSLAALIRPVFP